MGSTARLPGGGYPAGGHDELDRGNIIAERLGPARVEPLVQQRELALDDQPENLLVAQAAQPPVGLQQPVGVDQHPKARRERDLPLSITGCSASLSSGPVGDNWLSPPPPASPSPSRDSMAVPPLSRWPGRWPALA
jgi:hypothetical protein